MGSKAWIALALALAMLVLAGVFLLSSSAKMSAPAVAPEPKGDAPPPRSTGDARPRPNGTWASHAPKTLKVQEVGTVTLQVRQRISAAGTRVLAFAAAGSVPGTTESGDVVVMPRMSASLAGAAFKIDSASPVVQSTGEQGSASWAWQVLPQVAGETSLRLTLSAIDEAGPHLVLERVLPISVSN